MRFVSFLYIIPGFTWSCMLKRKMEEVLGMLDFLGSDEQEFKAVQRRSRNLRERKCACRGERHDITRRDLKLVLDDAVDTRPYNANFVSRVDHNGQLKLLLSEIEFLLPFKDSACTVIYAGAAPGIHIVLLAEMFENLRFVLVDPQMFAVELSQCGNVTMHQEFMTDELARKFKEIYTGDRLFISDVRIGPLRGVRESEEAQQTRIHEDMLKQAEWFRCLDAGAGMFKFRLPWDLQTTTYLRGVIHFPIFAKKMTHESRLVVRRGDGETVYDNLKYEGQMAYFNQVLRSDMYAPTGRCFDCAAFRDIIMRFLSKSSVDAEVEMKCDSIEFNLQKLKRRWNARRGRG